MRSTASKSFRRLSLSLGSAALLSMVVVSPARAENVCVAKPSSQMDAPRALGADGARALGSLGHRRCYSVMERMDRHTRIWVGSEGGFQGEVEVPNDVLAHVLTDDIEMVLEPGGEVFGKALSGAIVLVSPHPEEDLLRATLVEGRMRARFLVAVDDVYPAQSWPMPDPDEGPDGDWPEADLPLPPSGDGLLDDPTGMQLRAELLKPLARLDDLRNDPALGEMRMALLESREGARKVRLVGPTAWAEGWVVSSGWRKDVPATGWDSLAGFPSAPIPKAGARQVGSKPAPLHLGVKGAKFGSLQPGARVDVLATEKSWLQVRSSWSGGQVSGWLEKKRLVKEGKEAPLKAAVERVSAVTISRVALQWQTPEDHREEVKGEPVPAVAAKAEGEPVPAPEPKTYIVEPELGLDSMLSHLNQSMSRLQWLYGQVLDKTPTAGGEITVRLLVEPSGAVAEGGIYSASIDDEAIQAVISADLAELSFEKRRIARRKRGTPVRDWRIQAWVQYVFNSAIH